MNILITGGAGYIGSTMVRLFLDANHKVRLLDRFYFGRESIEDIKTHPNLQIINGDIRTVGIEIFEDIDTVIDLAAISNDPAGELNPTKTWDINFLGRSRIAFLAKTANVKHYIQASTCSIYGQSDQTVNETSALNPLTTYAKAHREQEKFALSLSDNQFAVTILRQATVYGLSHRMRFDIAINGMVAAMYENGIQGVMRDGTQWRPFVHVKDTSKAFLMVATSDYNSVNGEIFNVGSNEQNYQIGKLAEIIRNAMPVEFDWKWYGDPDNRSYNVDFSKIKQIIGFKPDYTPKISARTIYEALQTKKVSKTLKTLTVKWYQKLIETEKLYKSLSIDNSIL